MKLESNWKYKSLANLMREYANTSINYTTHLTKGCTELLGTPLNEYTVENLRIMIEQGFGLDYLIPLAIERLQDDLFAEGDLYPGDLLSSVLNIETNFWQQNQNYWLKVNELIANRTEQMMEMGISSAMFKNAITN
jgi:hypothetical protein